MTNPHDLAFPVVESSPDGYGGKSENLHLGVTKREYFAALAMQGLLLGVNQPNYECIAEYSLKMADALIQQLNKKDA